MLDLIDRTFSALNAQLVPYCHWKSNFSLAYGLSGGGDLDLLVKQESVPQVVTTLSRLGFKEAIPAYGSRTPGVSHHYGLDGASGRLVHVHLFSQVITGESLVKSHCLPLETMLLEDTVIIEHVRVPSPPAELVSFIVRTYIKYGSLLDLMKLLKSSAEVRGELQWLLKRAELSDALELLRQYLPTFDPALFLTCFDALSQPRTNGKRIVLAFRVRRILRKYARFSALTWILVYFQLALDVARARLFGKTLRKSLKGGSRIIAFVGADGTGKSTLAEACRSWLGESFGLRLIHAGKPPASLLTLPIRLILPAARLLWPRLHVAQIEKDSALDSSGQPKMAASGIGSMLYGFRAAALAWDRWRLLRRAVRRAVRGEIILCDRYPSQAVGTMDGPRLLAQEASRGVIASIYGWLSRLELRLYGEIPSPDIVLRLSASIETAKARNRMRAESDQDQDTYLERRHDRSQEWLKPGTAHVLDIDTEQPLQRTILSVKEAIWASI